MSYAVTIDHFANLAKTKTETLRRKPAAFFVGAMMAGAYVGIGIILIFSVGAPADPAFRKLVMGASFGIALTLVVFAGSELFTGHTMYMVVGALKKLTSWGDLGRVWAVAWIGNLAGSAAVGALFVAGGADLLDNGAVFLNSIAAAKISAGIPELLARAILCNWLVCLALWTSARTDNDTAKCILIFWCLFAFIASGFEHSVANMTVFTLALLGDPAPGVTLSGAAYNLFWVSIGNAISGAVLMGVGYWAASGETASRG